MRSALAWKPYGVSSSTALGSARPRRSKTSRWTLIIVGAVSPEPMIVSSRATRSYPSAVTASWRTVATSTGCCAWTSWSAGRNQCTRAAGWADRARATAASFSAVASASPSSAGSEQHRCGDRGEPDERVVLPEPAQHEQVVVERQPRLDGAVVEHAEAGQHAVDPLVGPVRVCIAQTALEVGPRGPRQRRRREPAGALLPAREAMPQVDGATVDADDEARRFGMAVRQLDHDVAAPGLADHRRSGPPEGVDHQGDVVGHRRHVVAAVGLVAPSVPPQVDRGDGVVATRQLRGDAVPQPRVRGEAVDEDDPRPACRVPSPGRVGPHPDRQPHAVTDRDTHLLHGRGG